MAETVAEMSFTVGRGELKIPEVAFDDTTSPAEVSRFFRGIWIANTIVRGFSQEPWMTAEDIADLPHAGPFSYDYGLDVAQDLVIPAAGNKPTTLLKYGFDSGKGNYRRPEETHSLLTAPEKAGPWIPYLVAHHVSNSFCGFDMPDYVGIERGEQNPRAPVPGWQVAEADQTDRDRENLALLNRFMRETVDLLS